MLENEPNFGKSSEVLAKKKANQTYIQSMISMTKLEWRVSNKTLIMRFILNIPPIVRN